MFLKGETKGKSVSEARRQELSVPWARLITKESSEHNCLASGAVVIIDPTGVFIGGM